MPGAPASAAAGTARGTDLALGIDAIDQEEGALGAAEELENRAALFPRQVGAQLQAPLARRQQELLRARPRRWRRRRAMPVRDDGPHRLRDLVERRIDQLAADRRERLALDAPRDLEQRFAQAGGEILFLDQAGQQVGLARAACRA